jgi:hypothetical protein
MRKQPYRDTASVPVTSLFPLYMIGGAIIILAGYMALASSLIDRKPAARVFVPVEATIVMDRASIGS